VGSINPIMLRPDSVTPAGGRYESGAGGVKLGPLPTHRTVLYVKDLAVTLVVLLALPYIVHRLLTRPGKVIDGGVSLP